MSCITWFIASVTFVPVYAVLLGLALDWIFRSIGTRWGMVRELREYRYRKEELFGGCK